VWRERILVYAPCDLARLHASIELPYSTLLIYSVYSLLLSLCLRVEEGEVKGNATCWTISLLVEGLIGE